MSGTRAEQPTELVNQAAVGVGHSVQEHREPGAGRHVFSGPSRRKKHPGQPLGAELIDLAAAGERRNPLWTLTALENRYANCSHANTGDDMR